MSARHLHLGSCAALAMVACGGSTTLPDAPAPAEHGCPAVTGSGSSSMFCDDFDESGQDATPFGFFKVETDGTPNGTTFATNIIDGNRVLSMTETESGSASLVAAAFSPLLPLTAGSAVSLQFDVELIGSNATATGFANLDLAAADGSNVLLELQVGSDGSLSIDAGSTNIPTTATLTSASWTTIALHAAIGSDGATLTAEAGPPGTTLQPVLASANVPLSITVTQAQIAVTIDPADAAEHDINFDNVALTTP